MEKRKIRTGFRLEKPEERGSGRSRHRWEDGIKIDLKERMWEVLGWIDLTQDIELVFNKIAYQGSRRRVKY
jgi:hypothetical protein